MMGGKSQTGVGERVEEKELETESIISYFKELVAGGNKETGEAIRRTGVERMFFFFIS